MSFTENPDRRWRCTLNRVLRRAERRHRVFPGSSGGRCLRVWPRGRAWTSNRLMRSRTQVSVIADREGRYFSSGVGRVPRYGCVVLIAVDMSASSMTVGALVHRLSEVSGDLEPRERERRSVAELCPKWSGRLA